MGDHQTRLLARTKCHLEAHIIFNDGSAYIDCVVTNLSSWGARLDVDGSLAVPNAFELYIPSTDTSYDAEARWRDPNSVGVEFVTPDSEDDKQAVARRELARVRGDR